MRLVMHVGSAALLVALIAQLAVAGGAAAESEPADRERSREAEAGSEKPREHPDAGEGDEQLSVYIPPSRGTTRTRTGGGTRAPGGLPALAVLAPDHLALTARAAPTLAWFASGSASVPLELSVLRDGAVDPALEVVLTEEVAPGIAQVSLARWGVELEEGVPYQWSVALVADPERRDRDVVASGAIERVAPSAELLAELEGEEPRYRVLARHGFWYDALGELGRRIEAGEEALRAERAALLEQVGLAAAAADERERLAAAPAER